METKIVTSDLRKLNDVAKALSDTRVVKVGVFGDKTDRKDKGSVTNAEIGFVHEFGSFSKNIPKRSWLRMPLIFHSDRIVNEGTSRALKMIAEGNMGAILRDLGHACENAIQRAFATKGFGSWAQNKYSTIIGKLRPHNKSIDQRRQMAAEALEDGARSRMNSPLIDTSQFRRAVASKVGAPS